MSLWSRLRHAVESVIDRLRGEEPEPPLAPEPPERGGIWGDDFPEPSRESQLPDGWVLVGLYHQGEKTQRIYATDDTEVTDSEIHSADALIVWYEDAGEDGYRWVHGATGWDSLSDQVEQTIIIVSPTGRGK